MGRDCESNQVAAPEGTGVHRSMGVPGRCACRPACLPPGLLAARPACRIVWRRGERRGALRDPPFPGVAGAFATRLFRVDVKSRAMNMKKKLQNDDDRNTLLCR